MQNCLVFTSLGSSFEEGLAESCLAFTSRSFMAKIMPYVTTHQHITPHHTSLQHITHTCRQGTNLPRVGPAKTLRGGLEHQACTHAEFQRCTLAAKSQGRKDLTSKHKPQAGEICQVTSCQASHRVVADRQTALAK